MTKALLITESLQNCFVQPINRTDTLPNILHVGFHEAARLVGDDPASSPLNNFISAAYAMDPDELGIVHIRDWHDPDDPVQAAHLKLFGVHGIKNTKDSEFIFTVPEACSERPVTIVNSLTLNDFQATNLEETLRPYAGQPTRVGIIGVWTEAKVTYLCYELRTRYPEFEIAVCSALTASSSRQQHFAALQQLQRLHGVTVMDSISDFAAFLGTEDMHLQRNIRCKPEILPSDLRLPDELRSLTEYLFRHCSQVMLKPLDGGFSGNYVFGVTSTDMRGHQEAPHVLKMGLRGPIARERTAFEHVEDVLGNNAPRIVDFADLDQYGGIKYRYASMGRGPSRSLQKIYGEGATRARVDHILDEIFVAQLGRLYAAGQMENCNLLEHYGFSIDLKPHVDAAVEKIMGHPVDEDTLPFFNGMRIPNPALFYGADLEHLKTIRHEQRMFAHVHGDLNGANILQDGNRNVWIIDFFQTHYGHILKDLIKLENDVLYIFTPVENEEQLRMAMTFTDCLLAVKDLATLPSFPAEIMKDPHFGRAARAVRKLRQYYPNLLMGDVDTVQAMIGQLRYSAHTMSFDEPTIWQKRWALYTSSVLASYLKERITNEIDLRIAWVPLPEDRAGKLGITILPGRQDRRRDLAKDIARLKDHEVTKAYALITDDELKKHGVGNLMEAYAANGITPRHIHVIDGSHPSLPETVRLVREIDQSLRQGENIIVHCVGGLGRSGTLAASYLESFGMSADRAIATVREARSPRAVETNNQVRFLRRSASRLAAHFRRAVP
ncbi:MAG: dual specificity protein phosphatase family protein [Alphaproteobacteria bacterium]|nr:dual specificity protein phosphatase family protein [Alphaproteobacteria bacterium]